MLGSIEMKCNSCGNDRFVEGSIEGMPIMLPSALTKTFSWGAYGVSAMVCAACGELYELRMSESGLEQFRRLVHESKAADNEGSIVSMQCETCQSTDLIDGSLEGAYFLPSKESKRGWLARPVHHAQAVICLSCGLIQRVRFDVKELQRSVKSD